jgi:hypothetical protein
MNVNSGGSHLLLFERDQQLTALLTSELQLAGYECHAARTAVEVFDAIARYPIRLVLVNLAQAAAGRREFWVALDAQRRGRGVQVFTFRCINLAGYGPDDPDERGRNVMADMEVDGMLGVMNLVDAVRARIPGSTTGSSPRIPATPVAARQAGTREGTSAGARESKDTPQAPPRPLMAAPAQAGAMPSATITGQVTSPLPMFVSNGTSAPSSPPVPSPARANSQPSVSGLPVPQAGLSTSSMPGSGQAQGTPDTINRPATVPPAGPGNAPSGFTDKIRAVIYPQVSRNFSQTPADQETTADSAWGTNNPSLQAGLQVNGQNLQNQSSTNSSMESGLEQLSRMVREQAPPLQEKEVRLEQQVQPEVRQGTRYESYAGDRQTERSPSGGQTAADSPPISEMSLRVSPIQDIAIERGAGGTALGGTSRQIVSQEVEPPIGSIGTVTFNSPVPSDVSFHPAAFVPPSTPALPPTPVQAPVSPPIPVQASTSTGEPSPSLTEDKPGNSVVTSTPATGEPSAQLAEPVSNLSRPVPIDRREESSAARTLVEQVQTSMQGVIKRNAFETGASADETLLNIMQSFPPMPSPSQSPQQAQPPVVSGRATRSLGSVLLEGHLVPQHRLEVAQQIQRMLRGVDMNYQLGEILLMFKLLTPDQLLAASLVSYGLISTMQISALGRIRQELHAIGLEYDLESLLVLFRILSPEQLREVRASWSG